MWSFPIQIWAKLGKIGLGVRTQLRPTVGSNLAGGPAEFAQDFGEVGTTSPLSQTETSIFRTPHTRTCNFGRFAVHIRTRPAIFHMKRQSLGEFGRKLAETTQSRVGNPTIEVSAALLAPDHVNSPTDEAAKRALKRGVVKARGILTTLFWQPS